MINDLKISSEWKIHLTLKINFMPSKDNNKIHLMYSKSDNVEIVTGFDSDEIIEELFHSFLHRY